GYRGPITFSGNTPTRRHPMPIRPRSRRRTLLPLLAALAALACAGEPATAPDSPDLARGGKPSDGAPPKVSFQNLVLESHTFVIDGASVGYTIDVVNRGKPLQGIILETRMWPNYTTGVHRAAGSTYLFCGADQGELPHGTC